MLNIWQINEKFVKSHGLTFDSHKICMKDGSGAITAISRDTVEYFVIISLILCILLIGTAFIHFNCVTKKRADSPKYFKVLTAFQHFIDFWTDCAVCIVWYIEQVSTIYSTLSSVFIIVPLIASIVSSLYYTFSWRIGRQDTARRLTNYLNKYQSFIYGSSIIIGFYSTIDLCQSKLFYKPIFYLPLTNNEIQQMKHFRFITLVVLEV